MGITMDPSKNDEAQYLRFKSFQVLSCVAPLIWIKLVRSTASFRSVVFLTKAHRV